ncbi:MAG TPA: OmpA family protein [Nitrospira sp.]|nr:OmpA family protein [Nitrospira sp.]
MDYRLALAMFATLLLLGVECSADELQCPPMPSAVTEISRDVRVDVDAGIGALGKIKVGQLSVKTESVAKNLFSKYPNLDRILTVQILSATYCGLLRSSTTLSERERLTRWEIFQDKILSTARFQSSEKSKTPRQQITSPLDRKSGETPNGQPSNNTPATISVLPRGFLPIKQGMSYDDARAALINSGWQAEKDHCGSKCGSDTVQNFNSRMCTKYVEWHGCGHVCDFFFHHADGQRLRVYTDHHFYWRKTDTNGYVQGWNYSPDDPYCTEEASRRNLENADPRFLAQSKGLTRPVHWVFEFNLESGHIEPSGEQERIVIQMIDRLKSIDVDVVAIMAQTDNIEAPKSDLLKLSRRRAQYIKDRLSNELGLSSEKIRIYAKGDEFPNSPNNTEQGRSRNRVVSVEILGGTKPK